jgi:hypothetical protein
LSKESAFSWWVRDVLKHRDRIIAASNTRYVKHTHKFGIELPKTVEEALDIDRKTCTTYWYDAIQKEMRNNAIAFEFLEPGESIPIGYTKLPFIWCSTLKLISHVKHA